MARRTYTTNEQRRQGNAARQAEFRARKVYLDRAAVEELLAAVEKAAAAGDELARKVKTGNGSSLLRNLARHFAGRSAVK